MRRLLPLVLVALSGCQLLGSNPDAPEEPRACTELYATVGVQVVDERGRPVDGLTTTSTNTRTGEVLPAEGDPGFAGEGRYVVASDQHLPLVREAGDPVRFRAEGAGRAAEAEFVIGHDGCHVQRRAGPEQIVARAG